MSLIREDAIPRSFRGVVSHRGSFVASPRVDDSVATSGKGEGASSAASFGDSLETASTRFSASTSLVRESEGSDSPVEADRSSEAANVASGGDSGVGSGGGSFVSS